MPVIDRYFAFGSEVDGTRGAFPKAPRTSAVVADDGDAMDLSAL